METLKSVRACKALVTSSETRSAMVSTDKGQTLGSTHVSGPMTGGGDGRGPRTKDQGGRHVGNPIRSARRARTVPVGGLSEVWGQAVPALCPLMWLPFTGIRDNRLFSRRRGGGPGDFRRAAWLGRPRLRRDPLPPTTGRCPQPPGLAYSVASSGAAGVARNAAAASRASAAQSRISAARSRASAASIKSPSRWTRRSSSARNSSLALLILAASWSRSPATRSRSSAARTRFWAAASRKSASSSHSEGPAKALRDLPSVGGSDQHH